MKTCHLAHVEHTGFHMHFGGQIVHQMKSNKYVAWRLPTALIPVSKEYSQNRENGKSHINRTTGTETCICIFNNTLGL